MESFSSFFFNTNKNKDYSKTKTPHHQTLRRITNRGLGFRNNNEEGINFKAKKYNQNDHNFDKYKNFQDEKLTNLEAAKICSEYNIDIRHLPKRLGNSKFEITGTPNNYYKRIVKDNV